MRYVMGWVFVVVAIGCGGVEPAPVVVPECSGVIAVPECPAGLWPSCDPTEFAAVSVDANGCTGAGPRGGSGVYPPTCAAGAGEATCAADADPVCIEAVEPGTPDECARWAAECAAMGATACYVPAGTDDVIPE